MQVTCNFFSYVLKRAVNINVIIPSMTFGEAMADSPSHKITERFPLLYLLHGGGNDYSTWERYTSIERYAEERRIAVVTLSGENKFYKDIVSPGSQPGSIMGGDLYYTFISKELPEFLYANFKVSDKPEDTYIAGLSMGGYGTLLHALSQPERFCALGAFSAAVNLQRIHGKVLDENDMTEEEKSTDPLSLLKKSLSEGKKLPKIYMSIGSEDFLYKMVVDFKNDLEKLGVDVAWDVMEGYGHEWAFWDIQIRKFLDWIPRTDSYYKDAPLRKI